MKYHLGLLDDDPTQNRVYQWVERRGWFKPGFPPDVLEELGIWFAMPGFTPAYHVRNLRMDRSTLANAIQRLGGYEVWHKQVAENWLSVTREDAIRLAHLRPGKRSSPLPLISQLKILDDLKSRKSQTQIARDFGCTNRAVYTILHKGAQWSGPLPVGFRLLVGSPP